MISSIIMGRSIRNNLKSPTNIISFLILTFLLAGIADYLLIRLMLIPALDQSKATIQHIMGLILYTTSLFSLAMNLTISTVRSLVIEKTRRMHETLLASPVSARQLWWGKCLAIFLPSYVGSLIFSALAYCLINQFFIAPQYGWIISIPLLLIPLLLNPLLYLLMGLLVTLVSLITDPVHANIIGQIFLPALASLTLNLGIRDIISTNRPDFFIIHLVLCGVLLLVIMIVRPRLSKQRVILSGRKA